MGRNEESSQERVRSVEDGGMAAGGKGRRSGRERCLPRADHLHLGEEKDSVSPALL